MGERDINSSIQQVSRLRRTGLLNDSSVRITNQTNKAILPDLIRHLSLSAMISQIAGRLRLTELPNQVRHRQVQYRLCRGLWQIIIQ